MKTFDLHLVDTHLLYLCASLFPFGAPQNAMQIVGFMEDEVQSVLELVAAVLKLGNIEFKPESRCNGTDESRIKDKNGRCCKVSQNCFPAG